MQHDPSAQTMGVEGLLQDCLMTAESCSTSNTRIKLDCQPAAQNWHDNIIGVYGHAISLKALAFMYCRRRGASNGNRQSQKR